MDTKAELEELKEKQLVRLRLTEAETQLAQTQLAQVGSGWALKSFVSRCCSGVYVFLRSQEEKGAGFSRLAAGSSLLRWVRSWLANVPEEGFWGE